MKAIALVYYLLGLITATLFDFREFHGTSGDFNTIALYIGIGHALLGALAWLGWRQGTIKGSFFRMSRSGWLLLVSLSYVAGFGTIIYVVIQGV